MSKMMFLSWLIKKGIPVLRSKHDTFTVATMINKALSNVQIKTDILTVEKLYRPSHEYGFFERNGYSQRLSRLGP